MVEIQDDKQNNKDRKSNRRKADVFSIDLDHETHYGLQLKMTQINKLKVLILYYIF